MQTLDINKSVLEMINKFSHVSGRTFSDKGDNSNTQLDDRAENLSNGLDILNNLLGNKRDELLEQEEFLKAYMIENQRIGVQVQSAIFKEGGSSIPDDKKMFAEKIMSEINKNIKNLNSTELISKEFSDYHNHDMQNLEDAFDFANGFIREQTAKTEIEPELRNNLNTMMRSMTSVAIDNFSKDLDSHAQKVGLAPTNEAIAEAKERNELLAQKRIEMAEQELLDFEAKTNGKSYYGL